MLAFFRERAKGKLSFWFPYFQLYDRHVSAPMMFSDDELKELAGTNTLIQAKQVAEEVDQFYVKLQQLLGPSVTYDEALNAVLFVKSRAFKIDGILYVIPGCDLFNHSPRSESSYDAYDGSVSMTVGSSYEPGDQVFLR